MLPRIKHNLTRECLRFKWSSDLGRFLQKITPNCPLVPPRSGHSTHFLIKINPIKKITLFNEWDEDYNSANFDNYFKR